MCVTVPHRDGKRRQLSREQIRTLLLEPAVRQGVMSLVVSGGEPTLRHDLAEILSDAIGLGMKAWLATNLLHVKEAKMRDLLERMQGEGHTIAVSFDSFVPSEMQIIRGGDYLGGVEANSRRLLALRREVGAKTHLRASLIVQGENLRSVLPTISHVLDEIGFDAIGVYLRHDYTGVTLENKDSQVASEWCVRNRTELIRVGMQLYKRAQSDPRVQLQGSIDDWVNFVTDPQRSQRPCGAGDFLFFNVEGRIRSCMFGTGYASVPESSLDDILNSEGFDRATKLHRSCSICTLACN
jgi:molybdenum cofactor biosynthesis enzyme MoaA